MAHLCVYRLIPAAMATTSHGETQGKNSGGFGLPSGRSRSTKGRSADREKETRRRVSGDAICYHSLGNMLDLMGHTADADIWTRECQKHVSAIEVIHGSCVGADAATVRASTRGDSC